MSDIKEVIRTSGDVRRTLAQAMTDIKHLKLYRKLAEEELLKLPDGGKIDATQATKLVHALGQITQLGRMIIEDLSLSYLRQYIGNNPHPELIEMKRQQLLAHRALKEFQKLLKEQTK